VSIEKAIAAKAAWRSAAGSAAVTHQPPGAKTEWQLLENHHDEKNIDAGGEVRRGEGVKRRMRRWATR
jgi:hypothetical protein